jgi:OOP family OmpA-OmpF porin
MFRAGLAMGLLVAHPLAGYALDLSLSGTATPGREVTRESESYEVPIGPFAEGAIPTIEVEGQFVQQTWRLEQQSITTLQMLAPMRAQLLEAGYDILLDCAGPECGGFDFRFATRVLPAPDMFVDLFDFRFLSARKDGGDSGARYVSILVSRSGATGYIQVIQVAPEGTASLSVTSEPARASGLRPDSGLPIADALTSRGHVILSDLNFESGSSDLESGSFASLEELAAFLKSDPGLRIALVGHTDTVGGLDPNIALSKRRAASVVERLVSAHGVPPEQLTAEGMGYLAPIAPNLTQAGREANRRVEAVLLNSD